MALNVCNNIALTNSQIQTTTMDDAWETDDPDVDIDDDEEPLSTFDGLVKGFLLAKQTDHKSREPTP
jgi:hypothetical protein